MNAALTPQEIDRLAGKRAARKMGWGLGLLVHGLVVFVAPPGSSFHQRLVQQERARLQEQQGSK